MSAVKDAIIRARAPFLRAGLKNRDFSILANNCWGGMICRDRRLPYNSPTCGTYFFAKDYLRFLSDPKGYLALELEEVPMAKSAHAEEIREKEGREVTVGRIGDAEVVLLHYPTFAEAKAKWDRRKARMNWDNLLVKFSDQNGFEPEDFETFRALPFRNKLFITTNPDYAGEFTCVLPDEWHQGYAVDDLKSSFRVLNVNDILNHLVREELS